MRIGNVQINRGPVFAPMAGVSDVAYRSICARMGAVLTYTEMVSALGLQYSPDRCSELRMRSPEETHCALQLFGDDPDVMARMGKKYGGDFDIIDVNMGCPAPKIVKNHQGSALMRDVDKASDIIKAMTDAIDRPITVKIRIGWDADNVNAVEFALAMEAAGAAAVAVHGRTRDQYYAGKADWNMIQQVKQALKVPVIGNGDIFRAEDAIAMEEVTGCDAVMVGRGAQGNPFLFRAIHERQQDQPVTPVDTDELIDVIVQHAQGLETLSGSRMMALKMRKHLCWYTKGAQDAAHLRQAAIKVGSMEDILDFLVLLRRNMPCKIL